MSLVKWIGPTNALVLSPKSPKFVNSDRVRATDIYMGLQSLCAASMLPRGTFGSGMRAGWVVNQCTVETDRGNVGTLTIEWEAGGAAAIQPLPIGDFSCQPQELYPKVERNGYFSALLPDNIKLATTAAYAITMVDLTTTAASLDQAVVRLNSIADPVQLALAQSLYQKLLRGEETFYLAGWRYSFELFSYNAPLASNGGFTGTPGGPLAGSLPGNVSWLRLADHIMPAGVNGSMFKNTITWLGGPVNDGVGYWDPDLYPAG